MYTPTNGYHGCASTYIDLSLAFTRRCRRLLYGMVKKHAFKYLNSETNGETIKTQI